MTLAGPLSIRLQSSRTCQIRLKVVALMAPSLRVMKEAVCLWKISTSWAKWSLSAFFSHFWRCSSLPTDRAHYLRGMACLTSLDCPMLPHLKISANGPTSISCADVQVSACTLRLKKDCADAASGLGYGPLPGQACAEAGGEWKLDIGNSKFSMVWYGDMYRTLSRHWPCLYLPKEAMPIIGSFSRDGTISAGRKRKPPPVRRGDALVWLVAQ